MTATPKPLDIPCPSCKGTGRLRDGASPVMRKTYATIPETGSASVAEIMAKLPGVERTALYMRLYKLANAGAITPTDTVPQRWQRAQP